MDFPLMIFYHHKEFQVQYKAFHSIENSFKNKFITNIINSAHNVLEFKKKLVQDCI